MHDRYLTAVYFLLLVNRTFFGRLSEQVLLPPIQWFDRTPSLILATLIVILGLQPGWMVRWSETTTAALMPTRSSWLLSIPPPPMRKFLKLAVLKRTARATVRNCFPRVPAMINTTLKTSTHPLAAYIERLKAGGACLPDTKQM